ncbi:MAG TPA: hypothetical protein VGN37_15150 [Actinocatenispora sp.]
MRHLSSFLAGIVVAVVAWAVLGWAQARLGGTAVTGINQHSWGTYQVPLLFFAVGGLLIGLIAATRISPSGPLIGGIGFVVLQLAYVLWPGFLNWLPDSVFGQHDIWTRPARSGMAAVLGLVMLVAVLSVRRWQRWPSAAGRHEDQAVPAGGQFPLSGSRPGAATADPGAEDTTRILPADNPSAGHPTGSPGYEPGGPVIGRPPETPER